MELHRGGVSILGGILLGAGIVVLAFTRPDSASSVVTMALAVMVIALGGWPILRRVRPFRFHIGPDGLTLRLKGINRLVSWSEIHAVVLTGDTPVPHSRPSTSIVLLLVPAASGFEAKLDRTSPVDGRPCLEILGFNGVKENSVEVAAALARYGGERFFDARALAAQAVIPQEFTVVLRGYDPAAVQAWIARAQAAIRDDSGLSRIGAKARLEQDLAKGLPIALRGYDRGQVDAVLKQLSDQIARW